MILANEIEATVSLEGYDSLFHTKKKKRNILKPIVNISAFACFSIFLFIIGYILMKGIPNLNSELFEWKYTSTNVSMMPAIITTLYVVFLSIIIAAPIGIFTAIYLVEYLDTNSKFTKIIRLTSDTLSGIPSIIYGLFGMLFFVHFLGLSNSVISGVLTCVIMILPVMIRSSEEALMSVKDIYRYGSVALGAGKVATVFKIVLPMAFPGIISGIILSIGRVVGESAALIYTLGTSSKLPETIFNSGRTLSVHMYMLSGEGRFIEQAFATAVMLVLLVILLNTVSELVVRKFLTK